MEDEKQEGVLRRRRGRGVGGDDEQKQRQEEEARNKRQWGNGLAGGRERVGGGRILKFNEPKAGEVWTRRYRPHKPTTSRRIQTTCREMFPSGPERLKILGPESQMGGATEPTPA